MPNALVLLPVLLVAAVPIARADVVGLPDACPPGSRGVAGHAGDWCEADECAVDDACAAGDERRWSCRTMRVCTESREIYVADRTGIGGGEDVAVTMVLETCAPGASCDGTGDRAPTAGRPVAGSRECRERRVCVPAPFPALAQRSGAPVADEGTEAVVELTSTSPSSSPSTPGACGCRAAPGARAPIGLTLLGFVLAWRRR